MAVELKQRELARRCKISETYMSQVLNGKAVPSLALAMKIQKQSGGKYRVVDLIPRLKEVVKEESRR